jgi:hypothetical protein
MAARTTTKRLADIARNHGLAYGGASAAEVRTIAAETIALRRVARAARMHSHAECAYDPIDESRLCSICRALASLDRASGRQRKGGRRE